jgi:FAD/FMN-containing dehydrogenase
MKALDRLMDFSEKYRPVFLTRSRREKVLFAVFLLAIALVWFGTVSGRLGATLRDGRLARDDVREQQRWFDNREAIEASYQRALASLDPAQIPPRAEVLARIQALSTQYGLNPRIDPPSSQRRDRLTFHTVNVSFDRVDYGKLAEFQRAAAAALPSVNLKTIRVTTASRAGGGLNARLTYEVIEYTN